MFATLRVLFDGERARAEDRLKDTYAVELIEQRIREAESNLSAAKLTLASLIQRKRSEERLAETLGTRARHGRAVNLDPPTLVLDMLLAINATAVRVAR